MQHTVFQIENRDNEANREISQLESVSRKTITQNPEAVQNKEQTFGNIAYISRLLNGALLMRIPLDQHPND